MTTVYCTSFSHFLAVIVCTGFWYVTKPSKFLRLSMPYFMFFNTHVGLPTVMYCQVFITVIPGNVCVTCVTFQALAKSGTCWKERNTELRCHDGNGKKAKGLGPVCTNAFSKVCVFVIIENASIDSHPHYSFDAFSTVHTKALSTLMRFQKYAFSLSSKTHRSIRVHTTFVMRFWQSRLRPCLHLFVFKSLRFRCHRKRIDLLASTLPFWCVFDSPL